MILVQICVLNIHVAFLVTVDVVSRVISVNQVLFVTSSNWPQGSFFCAEICPKAKGWRVWCNERRKSQCQTVSCVVVKGVLLWLESTKVNCGVIAVVFVKIRHCCHFYKRLFIIHTCLLVTWPKKVSKWQSRTLFERAMLFVKFALHTFPALSTSNLFLSVRYLLHLMYNNRVKWSHDGKQHSYKH